MAVQREISTAVEDNAGPFGSNLRTSSEEREREILEVVSHEVGEIDLVGLPKKGIMHELFSIRRR